MAEFTSYAHGTPCWVDVTSTDMERTTGFYGDLFGWQAETSPEPEAGGYTMFTLRGKNVAAASPPPPGGPQASYWTTYLASDDVDDTAAKIRDAGGTVLMDPFDVFDAGRMTVAQDPTGAAFGVWQANQMIGAELANEPGALNWNQCQTPDPARAAEFYAAALGFGVDEVDVGTDEPFRVLQVEGKPVAGVREPIPQMGGAPQWSVVFSVANTDETVAKAQELGGEVLVQPADLPEIGRIAVLRDPVGAMFQVIQPPPES
jgi:predicted enzyme related to lactoylglutathione lyase